MQTLQPDRLRHRVSLVWVWHAMRPVGGVHLRWSLGGLRPLGHDSTYHPLHKPQAQDVPSRHPQFCAFHSAPEHTHTLDRRSQANRRCAGQPFSLNCQKPAVTVHFVRQAPTAPGRWPLADLPTGVGWLFFLNPTDGQSFPVLRLSALLYRLLQMPGERHLDPLAVASATGPTAPRGPILHRPFIPH